MSLFSFLRIEFSILGIIAATFVFPVAAALCYKEYAVLPAFLVPMAVAIALALVFFVAGKKKENHAVNARRLCGCRLCLDFRERLWLDSILF